MLQTVRRTIQFVQVRTSAIAPCIWQSLVRCSVFVFGV